MTQTNTGKETKPGVHNAQETTRGIVPGAKNWKLNGGEKRRQIAENDEVINKKRFNFRRDR